MFSRNSKIFEEGLERPNCVVGKYDDKNNFQYISCIGKLKPAGKSTWLHQTNLYQIAIFPKQQIVKENFNKILSVLCAGNPSKFSVCHC